MLTYLKGSIEAGKAQVSLPVRGRTHRREIRDDFMGRLAPSPGREC